MLLKSLALATLGLTQTATAVLSSEPCPAGHSTRFKWQWKENYAQKKIGSFKLKRRNLENEVEKKANKGVMDLPDYLTNGWTIILNFDKPIAHGNFHLNVGYDLSTNMAGNAIAFHSHPWNKELLEKKRNWFEIIFDFDQDHEDFDLTSVEVLEGEFANVQCRFGDDGFDSLGVIDSNTGEIVSHIDADTVITPVYNGVVPYVCDGGNNGPTECPCDNGTGETLDDCSSAVCIDCDDGFDLINSEFCQDSAITAAQDEVEARLDAANAAKCSHIDCMSITIMWVNTDSSAKNDLDIWVTLPSGAQIGYNNKNQDGGVLDVDAQQSTAEPVENVIFENGAPVGSYKIEVKNYSANHSNEKTVTLALQKPGETFRSITEFQVPGVTGDASIITLAEFTYDG